MFLSNWRHTVKRPYYSKVLSRYPNRLKGAFHSVLWDSNDKGHGSHVGVPKKKKF